MPTPNQLRLIRISDNPAQKTVTAFFSDNTSVILENVSGDANYVLPPGYGVTNGNQEVYRPLFVQHCARYTDSLNTLAVQQGLNIQGMN